MKNRRIYPQPPLSDIELLSLLMRHDPAQQPSDIYLQGLESSIMASLGPQPALSRQALTSDSLLPPWMINHGAVAQAMAITFLLVVVFGFTAGFIFYDGYLGSTPETMQALLAFADEISAQDDLQTIDASQGNSHEDAQ